MDDDNGDYCYTHNTVIEHRLLVIVDCASAHVLNGTHVIRHIITTSASVSFEVANTMHSDSDTHWKRRSSLTVCVSSVEFHSISLTVTFTQKSYESLFLEIVRNIPPNHTEGHSLNK